MAGFEIVRAGGTDLPEVAALFRAYAAGLPIDLGAQGFIEELAGLPGDYAPPGGVILLARDPAGTANGCVALRRLDPGACELKRLYVSPAARGSGLGKALLDASLAEARHLGYREMKLDTLGELLAAIALYRAVGFDPIPPYGHHPYPGTLCFGRVL
jgi:GNAT superfamily N-acetyltransferase